jgi:hypothetical protein
MYRLLVVALALAGCHAGDHQGQSDASSIAADAAHDAKPDAALVDLQHIYDEVDAAHLAQLVKELSGAVPVMVDGQMITIDERYSDAGRAKFRAYWTQYMRNLGLTVTPLPYQAMNHPRGGDDLEAVVAGARADSVVVIVHYDSIGPPGAETKNPGADDDMSGMAIELETARILVAHQAQLVNSVRFVASDEEELGGLAGARYYAKHVQQLAQTGGWHLVAAIDDEQSGWNCHAANGCSDSMWPAFDVFSCGMGNGHDYDYAALGDQFASIVATYEPAMQVKRACMGQNSDHFAMWEIGVPTVVYSEHDPFVNPHFDQNGGDTFDKIDTAYLASIARPGITFQAQLAGIPK